MIRCLLVTGDRGVRDMIRVGLDQTQAFEVSLAEDRWALQLIKQEAFDLVLADTSLADGSDGVDFLRQVRELLPSAEFALISRAKTQSRYLARDKDELGISALIHVPITASEFFRVAKGLMDSCATMTVEQSHAAVG